MGYTDMGFDNLYLPVEVETEFMISWAKENPNLFSDKFNNFFIEYPSEYWEHKSKARKGYIILVAVKK